MKNFNSLKVSWLLFSMQLSTLISIGQPGGNSLLLDGLNNYAVVADNPALDFSDSLSFEGWINPGSDTNHLIISKKWCFNSNSAYYVDLIGGKISFGWSPNGNCGNGVNLVRTDSVVIQPY